MNGKRMLAMLLAVSIGTAAASMLAEGNASGPADDPQDLPTADAWEKSVADDFAVDTAYAAAPQYETITGQWTLDELAAMDAPPVTGDAPTDDALAALWDTLRSGVPAQSTADNADKNSVPENADNVPQESPAPQEGPALTGDAKTDSQLEAQWKAEHPEETPEEIPEALPDPASTPEAASVAGPDDGGARPERELTKNEVKDAQKRERLVENVTKAAETLSDISFEDVERRAREQNLTVLSLEKTISGLENLDYEKSEEDLLKALNALSAQEDALLGSVSLDIPGLSAIPGLSDALSAIASEPVGRSSALASLRTQYNSLYASFEQLRDGTTRRSTQDGIEQLHNTVNQVVMGAESLYVALIAMQNQRDALNRQLESLNRTVEELELRYSLGQISALNLNQSKAGRVALVSGIETLEMNIRTYKMQLENMLGASLTGNIKLGALPAVTEAQIAALDADRDFAAAHDKSYELYAAARTLQNAQETYQDKASGYHYNENNTFFINERNVWEAAQDTYNVTVRGYELKFRTLYEQVHDNYQILNASKEALAAQKLEYQAKELQYKQGNISKNTLLSAHDSLSEKEEAVRTAENNLFSAYNNYCWAVQTGILN